MTSKAYDKFNKTIKRCEHLIDSFHTLKNLSEENADVPIPKDIVRGAVVLSVSALDAYVTDVFSEKLVPYLKKYKPDRELIDLLYNAGLDTHEALQLITMDRPYRRIQTLIKNYYARYTTQKFDVIDQIFLPYRLKHITDNAENKSKKRNIKKSVNKLVERRHRIAHHGDYNSHGRIVKIDERRIEKRINHLSILVLNIDEIICNRI